MLLEKEEEEGKEKMTRFSFGLIPFTYTTQSPGNIVLPLKLVYFPLHGSMLCRRKYIVQYAWDLFLRKQRNGRILSVLHTYLDLTSGDKTNENSDLLIIYILVENLYMLLRYL